MMIKFLMSIAMLCLLSGCDERSIVADQVIMIRDGQMRVSNISSYGSYCWVSWYDGIEHVILKSDGTADDPPFHYRWEPLKLSERDRADEVFKRNNCHDPNLAR